ncbi:MAG: hypothetical protein Q9210_000530 [Variospora velana]
MDDLHSDCTHWPIETIIDIQIEREPLKKRRDWSNTDRELLGSSLTNQLPIDIAPRVEGLEEYTNATIAAVETAIEASTSEANINPQFSHKGFNDQCKEAVKDTRRARRTLSMHGQGLPGIPRSQIGIQQDHERKEATSQENAPTNPQGEDAGDHRRHQEDMASCQLGQKQRLTPTIVRTEGDVTYTHTTKTAKAKAFAKSFFPTPLTQT